MNTKIRSNKVSAYISLVVGALMIVATVIVGLPADLQAATYGYVNNSGNVVYTNANSSDEAFANSINRDPNSGVMLINSVSDSNIVGDQI